RNTLCTVELSKELLPDMPSYSLGKLVRSLGIPITDRHRAQGDAKATVELFRLLLQKDTNKEIIQASVRKDPKRHLDTKLLDIIAEAPSETGVYYMHKEDGTIIYIGKSKNIKKRLTQHFTSDNRKSKKIQLDVATVTYELTGNELIALLKESEEIKANKPAFNRALRKTLFQYQLNSFEDENGYINLKIEKADATKQPITTFTNYQQAKSAVYALTEKYNLCQKLTGLHKTKGNCFNYTVKDCEGACIQEESAADYNIRVQLFLDDYSYAKQHMLIIDRGREVDERSVILIENGEYKGYGYYHLNYQVNNPEVLKSIITPMSNNRDAQHIIQTYLKKRRVLKIIPLGAASVN
ncbi:MAG: GIY-YIG nuclease family protein, partial [Marinirhabdus sp.]|nr:GIY-YIG nuclease family protein [Marinirhabdus sp.]